MKNRLADPGLRRDVEAAVRRRVRGDDAEDVVQATLTDVLSAAQVPSDPDEFRRFVFGVARNKVFDHFRRQKRQTEGFDDDATEGPEQPLSARDILRWAEGELPDSEDQHTLEWMLREGAGEKLEHIARDARLPAPRVRQRVSRLRKFLRERWAAELMLAGLLALLGALGALYWYAKHQDPNDIVEREPPRPVPSAPRAPEPSRPAGSSNALPGPVPQPSVVPVPSASSNVAPVPSAVSSSDAPAKQLAPKQPTKKNITPSSLNTEEPLQLQAPPKTKPAPQPSKADSDFSEPAGSKK